MNHRRLSSSATALTFIRIKGNGKARKLIVSFRLMNEEVSWQVCSLSFSLFILVSGFIAYMIMCLCGMHMNVCMFVVQNMC